MIIVVITCASKRARISYDIVTIKFLSKWAEIS